MNSQPSTNEPKQSASNHCRFSSRSIAAMASTVGISVTEDECRHVADELYHKTKELLCVSYVHYYIIIIISFCQL